MWSAIAFGLAIGAGVQATRNLPPDGPVTANGAALVLVVAVVCAYVGGRWRGRGRGGAVAVASAEATAVASAANHVNFAVFTTGQGAGASRAVDGGVVLYPSESAPWLGEPRQVVDESILEGADLRDFAFEEE